MSGGRRILRDISVFIDFREGESQTVLVFEDLEK